MDLGLDFQTLFELLFALTLLVLWLAGYFSGQAAHNKSSQRRIQKAEVAPQPAAEETARPQQRPPPRGASPGSAEVGRGRHGLEQLLDHRWVTQQVTQLSTQQFRHAFRTYRSAMEAGLRLAEVPEPDREQMLITLAVSAIRLNSCGLVRELLLDLHRQGVGITEQLMISIVKSCAAKQFFAECLSIYEAAEKRGQLRDLHLDDRAVWSCLLLCAVERGCEAQGRRFLVKLRESGALTAKDVGNGLRLTLLCGDWKEGLELLDAAQAGGVKVDVVKYNTVLGTCVNADEMDQAQQLLVEMEQRGVADVVAFNTMMKGYAKRGDLEKCFEIRQRMAVKGLAASQVTHGILLNACVTQGATEHMSDVFNAIVDDKCPMNAVLYTTLIKGFARAGQVDRAMPVYEHMRSDDHAQPDLITFSVLIKATCDAGQLENALVLLAQMKAQNLVPDEIIYNNLLAGCALQKDHELGERLYTEMIQSGIRPSNVCFSILIRLYSECKLLEKAVEVVVQEPVRHKVAPEMRLFLQIIQSCIRLRQGQKVVDVYQEMLRQVGSDTRTHSTILRSCSRLNMFDTAAEVIELAAEGNQKLDVADLNALMDVALRKRKLCLSKTCTVVAARLRLDLDPALLACLESQKEERYSLP